VNHSQIRQLVNDDLRLCPKHRRRQGIGIEHVHQDRARAELKKEFALVRRMRRPPDRMAVGEKQWRKPAANDAGRASQEDPTHETQSALRCELRPADIC
jgi:hypothetical protein